MNLFLGPCFFSGGTLLFPLLIFLFSLFPPAPPLYLFFFLHLRRNSSEDKGDDDEGPLFCDVSGQAAYPTMKVIDARSALLSPHELWKQFNLRALNYELSTPLSPAQLKLNRATGVGDGVS